MINKSPEFDNMGNPQDSLFDSELFVESKPVDARSVNIVQTERQRQDIQRQTLSEGGLPTPREIRDAATPDEEAQIQDLINNKAFTREAARQRVLKDRYIPASPPPNTDNRETGRIIKIDRRKLGPKQQNTADGDKRVESMYGKPGERN